METSDLIAAYAAARVATHLRLAAPPLFEHADPDRVRGPLERQHSADYRARDEAEIMLRKNWEATGAFYKEDRRRALGVEADFSDGPVQYGWWLERRAKTLAKLNR